MKAQEKEGGETKHKKRRVDIDDVFISKEVRGLCLITAAALSPDSHHMGAGSFLNFLKISVNQLRTE